MNARPIAASPPRSAIRWPVPAKEVPIATSNLSTMAVSADDLANGKNIVFCATGISDSALLRGVRSHGASATTHSILMRAKSRTVRFIRATHDLSQKTIRLRSTNREARI